MVRTFVLVGIATLSCSVPAPATAARPASPAEVQAIAPSDPACAVVTISTVDSTWARAATRDEEGCDAPNRMDLYRADQNGAWSYATTTSRPLDACPIGANTPEESVALDLQACRRHRTYAGCLNRLGDTVLRRVAPARCELGNGTFGTSIDLYRLRWSGWGRSTATAVGESRSYHLPRTSIRVRARAYRVRRCDTMDATYTRYRVTWRSWHYTGRDGRTYAVPGGHHTWARPACPE